MGEHDSVTRYCRNITVMFTDIKGSTAYYERFGDSAGFRMVRHCNSTLGKIAESHGGWVIKTIGDSVMAAFEDITEAVAAAVEMQRAMTAENVSKPEEERIAIRIGLNYGPGIVQANDVFGDVANTASRVETTAAPGQIVVSDTLHQALGETVKFRFRCLGRFALKGKAETRELFEVVWDEQASVLPTVAHSLVALEREAASLTRITLQHIRSDGSRGTEYKFERDEMFIGNSEGDLTFPHDGKLRRRHARLSLEGGQLFVECLEDSVVFFSLMGPYRLQDGDAVKMGQQLFQFRANTAAMEAAAARGTTIGELHGMLKTAPAEFLSAGAKTGRYPLIEEVLTFGREKGTYTFPDDATMSRSHAKVYHRGEDFFLEDTGSRNGTFVRVRERTPIPAGAMLSLGGQLLRVVRVSDL